MSEIKSTKIVKTEIINNDMKLLTLEDGSIIPTLSVFKRNSKGKLVLTDNIKRMIRSIKDIEDANTETD